MLSQQCTANQLAARDETIVGLNAKLARIQEYGIDTRNFGDGDAQALFGIIEAFRADPGATLLPEEVRELVEWWAELHTALMDLDEKVCARDEAMHGLCQAIPPHRLRMLADWLDLIDAKRLQTGGDEVQTDIRKWADVIEAAGKEAQHGVDSR